MPTLEEQAAARKAKADETQRRRQAKPLTPRQLLFAQAVAHGLSYTKAAEQAGYAAKLAGGVGSQLAKLPRVQDEIARVQSFSLLTKEWSMEWWRKELAAAHRAAIDARDLPSRLRALELAGRHLGALDSQVDKANAELAEQLRKNLVLAMAAQLAAGATASAGNGAGAGATTIEGEVRRTLAIGEGDAGAGAGLPT